MTIFARAASYANLSPLERAFLRFLGALVWGAFIAAGQAALPLLSSPTLDPTTVPWAAVAHTFLATFSMALLLGISKYHSAQADPPLPTTTPITAPSPPVAAAPIAGAGAAGAGVPAAPPPSSLATN